MKNLYILFILSFFAVNKVDAQQTICHGDSVTINVTGHNGAIQWQFSDDQLTWFDIPAAISPSITTTVRSIKYFRAKIITGTCNPFYSNVISIVAEGCPCPGAPTVTDSDGLSYPTIKIGNQCWMAKNLNTGTAKLNNQSLSTSSIEKYCYGATNTNFDPFSNCQTYGGLYTWAAVMQGQPSSNAVPSGVQGICPTGWHIPSDEEWKILEVELELPNPDLIGWRGTTQGTQLKQGGTSNFDGLLGGKREHTAEYLEMGTHAYFWSTTQSSPTAAWLRALSQTNTAVGRFANQKAGAHSVRCVKD